MRGSTVAIVCVAITTAALRSIVVTPAVADPLVPATAPMHPMEAFAKIPWGDSSSRKSLAGRVAVVTGGSSGIGKAVAKELYDRGCTVVITSRTQARASAAAAEIMVTMVTTTTTDSGADDSAVRGVVTPMTLDTSDLESVRAFAAAVLERFTAINYLVENAGAVHGPQTTDWVSPQGYEQLCKGSQGYECLHSAVCRVPCAVCPSLP